MSFRGLKSKYPDNGNPCDDAEVFYIVPHGHFDLTRLNDAGRELMSGLRSQLIGAEKRVPLLTF